MSEAEARVLIVAQARVKQYKTKKDFHNEKVMYSTTSYLLCKSEVRSKVALYFPTLDLSFLDKELEEFDDEPALELEDATGPSSDTDPPPLAT